MELHVNVSAQYNMTVTKIKIKLVLFVRPQIPCHSLRRTCTCWVIHEIIASRLNPRKRRESVHRMYLITSGSQEPDHIHKNNHIWPSDQLHEKLRIRSVSFTKIVASGQRPTSRKVTNQINFIHVASGSDQLHESHKPLIASSQIVANQIEQSINQTSDW